MVIGHILRGLESLLLTSEICYLSGEQGIAKLGVGGRSHAHGLSRVGAARRSQRGLWHDRAAPDGEKEPVRPLLPAPQHNFFFQAEDGIRDLTVTGVQTCTLPI